MIRVAVTRTLPEAERTAERLRALGAEPVLAPLLTIAPCAYDTNTEGAQALIFTSINGVRAFPDTQGARNRKVFTVGDATADAARTAGFLDVHSADGDVETLAALVIANLNPTHGKLIHIAGDHVAGDLAGALQTAGFRYERRQAFASIAATTLPSAFSVPLDAVLFHSARAAETFLGLGAPKATDIVCACLSQAVADAAAKVVWKKLIVAPAPREDALLAALLRD